MAGPPRGILPDGSVPVLLVFSPCYRPFVLFLFPLMLVPFVFFVSKVPFLPVGGTVLIPHSSGYDGIIDELKRSIRLRQCSDLACIV